MSKSSNPLLLGTAIEISKPYTRIMYDVNIGVDGPIPGDTLETATGRRYLVIAAERVKRRSPKLPARFKLQCERLDPADAGCGGAQWSLKWNPRSRKGGSR